MTFCATGQVQIAASLFACHCLNFRIPVDNYSISFDVVFRQIQGRLIALFFEIYTIFQSNSFNAGFTKVIYNRQNEFDSVFIRRSLFP